MGIKDFFKLFNPRDGKTISDYGVVVELDSLRDQRICLDTSNLIYRASLAMPEMNSLTDTEGNPTAHIMILLSQIVQYVRAGIRPIFVLDPAVAPELKRDTLANRKAVREKAAAEGDQKRGFVLTSAFVEDLKHFFELCGIMYVVAPNGVEAEHYGAQMVASGFCTYMLSSDSDVLLFGGNLLRPEKIPTKAGTGKSKKTVYKTYSLATVCESFAVSRADLVKISVALGSDFAHKSAGIGAKTARKKLESIVLTAEQMKAHAYFMSEANLRGGQMQQKPFDRDSFIAYLKSKNFGEAKITKAADILGN